MATPTQPPPTPPREGVGPAVQEISFRAQQLVREEIELAKAEISAKVTSLLKGVVIGVAGGIFGVVAFLAARMFKKGTPPKPEMAIDEAQRIKRTVDEARR